jgi:hypothetical protein
MEEWDDACRKLFGRPAQGILVGLTGEERALLLQRLVAHFRNEPDFVFTEEHCEPIDDEDAADDALSEERAGLRAIVRTSFDGARRE